MRSDYSKFPVPEGWEDTAIGEVSEVVGGGTPSKENLAYWNGGIAWATPTDITALNGRYISRTASKISELGLKNSGASLLPAQSVLMTSRATIGSCAINTVPMATNQGFASLVPRNGLSTEFLYYLLTIRVDELQKLAAGSTFVELGRRQLRELRLLCPPKPQQRKIVEILNSTDDAIEATQAVIKQTRQLKTALLQDLLTNGLPGKHKKFKEVKNLGRIPADWDIARLGEIATVERGKFTHRPRNDPRFYGGEIPFVQTGDVVASGDYLREHSQTLNKRGLSVSRLFPKGTILFAIAASVGATTIASYDVAFPDSLVGITPKSGIHSLFLLRVLQRARDRIISTATESAQANISLELLRPIRFAIPPTQEQEAIAEIVRSVEERKEHTQTQLNQLSHLKRALSQGLLTGRIPVTGQGNTT